MQATAASPGPIAGVMHDGAPPARAWTAQPNAFAAAACCALLLLLAGCQRAQPDYEACVSAARPQEGAPALTKLVAPEVRKCMEAKGWRLVRPSLPPGSNAWARIPDSAAAVARRQLQAEPVDRRPK